MKKILDIFNYILNERVNWSLFTIVSGKIKLWHYSNKNITNKKITINNTPGLQSGEFKEWGKGRSFFYGVEGGNEYDTGISDKYLYICYVDYKKIYDIDVNKNRYVGTFQDMYEQSFSDGYIGWTYNLSGNKNVPIVILFVDVKISEAYVRGNGGVYVDKDAKFVDYKIGNVVIEDTEYVVFQKGGYIKNLLNTYIVSKKDSNKKSPYRKRLPEYMWKHVKLLPKFKSDYR